MVYHRLMRNFTRTLGFLCFFMSMGMIYLSYVLFDLFPPSMEEVFTPVYLLNFGGTLLGALLCPLFLPLPMPGAEGVRGKKPWVSVLGIGLMILPQIIIRGLGMEFWRASLGARIILALDSGMFYSVSYGLFLMTQFRGEGERGKNRTARFCPLWMGAALMGAMLIRFSAAPLLEVWGLSADPAGLMGRIFKALQGIALGWGMITGVLAVWVSKSPGNRDPALEEPPGEIPGPDTDWSMIFRFVGLSATFNILNSLLGMRLFLLTSGMPRGLQAFSPGAIPVVLGLCFFAGGSRMFKGKRPGNFLRALLIALMLFFIMLPNLSFAEGHPRLTLVMNSLIFIARFSTWIIFTIAVAEPYRGGRWFYLWAGGIFLTHGFSYLGPLLDPLIPKGAEFTVLVTASAAAVFTVLGMRTLLPGPLPKAKPPPPSAEDIFKEYELTEREAEIAQLLLEGLTVKAIADQVCLAKITADKHVSAIYRKFKVDSRANFMKKFIAAPRELV